MDGVITRKYFYIPLIYGRNWYEVEGSVLVDPTYANPSGHLVNAAELNRFVLSFRKGRGDGL